MMFKYISSCLRQNATVILDGGYGQCLGLRRADVDITMVAATSSRSFDKLHMTVSIVTLYGWNVWLTSNHAEDEPDGTVMGAIVEGCESQKAGDLRVLHDYP